MGDEDEFARLRYEETIERVHQRCSEKTMPPTILMPTRASILRVLAAVATFSAVTSSVNAQASVCWGSDASAIRLRSFVRQLSTGTDTVSVALRNAVQLVRVDSTKITLVTDSKTCASLLTGYNSAASTPGRARRLYVVSAAGRSFAVVDSAERAGEWRPTMFFDAKFKMTRAVMAP